MKEYFYRLSGSEQQDGASEQFASPAEAIKHGEEVARDLAGSSSAGRSVLTVDENNVQIGQARIGRFVGGAIDPYD
jgi:hypothetical protein